MRRKGTPPTVMWMKSGMARMRRCEGDRNLPMDVREEVPSRTGGKTTRQELPVLCLNQGWPSGATKSWPAAIRPPGLVAYDGEIATNVTNSGVECLSACLSEAGFYSVLPNPVTLGEHVLRSPVGRQE